MKKKILFFHFDLGGGGAENVLVNLVNNLDSKKYDITIQLLFNHGIYLTDLNDNIHVKYVFNRPPFHGITKLMKILPATWYHKLYVRDKYDIEIAFIESSPTRIISGCRDKHTKLYSWQHTSYSSLNRFLSVYQGKSDMKKCFSHIDKIACVSEFVRENFLSWSGVSPNKCVVVNNILEIEKIIKNGNRAIDFQLSKEKMNLCSVGRLHIHKGYVRMMNVLGLIKKSGLLNWHFYLVGEGEQRTEIEKKIAENDLCNSVTLLGYDVNPQKYVSKCDLFVCPSYKEGYSTAVTESIIVHTPVLTTDCSGMSEIFGDSGCGMIVPNEDAELENGLRYLLTHPEKIKEMKQRAIDRAQFFSKERCIKQFEDFIGE